MYKNVKLTYIEKGINKKIPLTKLKKQFTEKYFHMIHDNSCE